MCRCFVGDDRVGKGRRGARKEWGPISQTYEAALYPVYILLDVFIYRVTQTRGLKAEGALGCCKTEHYYPSSPLPRTLGGRPGNRVEEGAMAKTKNPGNYGVRAIDSNTTAFQPST